jgi:hypothetical protein
MEAESVDRTPRAARTNQKEQKVENPGFDPGASSLRTTHSTD